MVRAYIYDEHIGYVACKERISMMTRVTLTHSLGK